MTKKPTTDTDRFASPVCFAGEASAAYNGMAEHREIVAVLEELLRAERAGARVAGETAGEVGQGDTAALLSAVRHDEARWCAMLTSALRRLNSVPSQTVGEFYDKAMAIADTDTRLAFLNRGQAWVVRKLEDLLPRIRDERLRDELANMRKAHIDNIRLTEELLVARNKN